MMKFIKVESIENVKIVSLNRPEVKNAFHPEMILEITTFFEHESSSATTSLIILKGEGTAFCAGADLNWMKSMVDYSYDENIDDSKKLAFMFESIQNCDVPVVGVAHGAVFGGALGLLACCDYVFVEEKTQFCFSEVKLGLAPAVISAFFSQKMQDAYFRPLMLSAEVFHAAEAVKIGLAAKTYKDIIDINDIIKLFSANGPQAMRETKKLLNSFFDEAEHVKRINSSAKIISERRTGAEAQTRLKNFLNKTK